MSRLIATVLVLMMPAILTLTGPAVAERVVLAVSSETVSISSNFSGTDITIFGSIERDQGVDLGEEGYDVVAVIKGPPVDAVTRKKERVFGVWINRNERTFLSVPSFYALSSNRPPDDIAQSQALQANQIGLANIIFPVATDSIQAPGNATEFALAYRRLKANNDLFSMNVDGIDFLTPTIFKSTMRIPARVSVGTYSIEVFVFDEGALVAHDEQTLWISKAGLEQLIYDFSRERGLLFGVFAVLLAVFVGWFGGVVFRRE
ncbi:MAG: TIGR02186 family protein [Hyphomicrobiales bacterium]